MEMIEGVLTLENYEVQMVDVVLLLENLDTMIGLEINIFMLCGCKGSCLCCISWGFKK